MEHFDFEFHYQLTKLDYLKFTLHNILFLRRTHIVFTPLVLVLGLFDWFNNHNFIHCVVKIVMIFFNARTVLPIPKSAFKSDQQRHDFIEFCRENIKNSILV